MPVSHRGWSHQFLKVFNVESQFEKKQLDSLVFVFQTEAISLKTWNGNLNIFNSAKELNILKNYDMPNGAETRAGWQSASEVLARLPKNKGPVSDALGPQANPCF